MLFMVVEKFYPGKVKDLYMRFAEKGRMMPEGVAYINSWINLDIGKCFQVMESDHEEKIHAWVRNWDDLAEFEVIPVVTSAEAKEIIFSS